MPSPEVEAAAKRAGIYDQSQARSQARRAQCAALGVLYVPPALPPAPRPVAPYDGRVEDVLIAMPRPQPTEPVAGLSLWFGISQLVALLIIAAAMVALHYASNPQ